MPKLLIADDSALMRKILRDMFAAEPDFQVITARNGAEALDMARNAAPDVITLDVNMPEMDGLTCLSRIMVECPKPVVMVSSLTSQGAQVTFEALELGAIDFIAKPDGTVSLHIDTIRPQLIAKVRNAAKARIRQSRGLADRVRSVTRPELAAGRAALSQTVRSFAASAEPIGEIKGLVLIGSSTGGPGALEAVLTQLPGNFPWPILVAQHMPESFTGVFARRINNLTSVEVIEVTRPTPLRAGTVHVGRGDADMLIAKRAGVLTAVPAPASSRYLWHPSVDRMVASALENFEPTRVLGVLMTGMGDDGAETMKDLKARGGATIAESEETAVVWGMPGELVKRGGASMVLPLDRIAEQICRMVH